MDRGSSNMRWKSGGGKKIACEIKEIHSEDINGIWATVKVTIVDKYGERQTIKRILDTNKWNRWKQEGRFKI